MRLGVIISAFLVLLAGCMKSDDVYQCMLRADEEYLLSVSEELKRRNVGHHLKGSMLCYKNIDEIEVNRARTFVDSYRYGVAALIGNEADERKIVDWLITEKKSYEVNKTLEGNRMLIIHSISQEDEEANRTKLDELITED